MFKEPKKEYYQMSIETPLGPMLAIGDDQFLYFLEFAHQGLESKRERFLKQVKATVVSNHVKSIDSIESELNQYFSGKLTEFKTPLFLVGSLFQQCVWEELRKIPFGQTRSYSELAAAVGKRSACRAVAQINGANRLAVVIPCHRVINKNETIGGYAGGVSRKKWLLELEKI